MVGLFKVLPSLVLASFAAAQATLFKITQPSSSIWWVAESQNVMAWDCQADPSISNFTVLINNTTPAVLSGSLAIISQLDNNICSYALSQSQVNQAAATGYMLVFANPLNNSDVYATSELFEIKALGSAYPTTSSSLAASGTATSSSSSSATPSTAAALGAHNPSSIGLAGVMGLLVAAVLGA